MWMRQIVAAVMTVVDIKWWMFSIKWSLINRRRCRLVIGSLNKWTRMFVQWVVILESIINSELTSNSMIIPPCDDNYENYLKLWKFYFLYFLAHLIRYLALLLVISLEGTLYGVVVTKLGEIHVVSVVDHHFVDLATQILNSVAGEFF